MLLLKPLRLAEGMVKVISLLYAVRSDTYVSKNARERPTVR